ncbi:MAG: hypothetical protein ACRYHA_26970 [Janthinobacterium lividum]
MRPLRDEGVVIAASGNVVDNHQPDRVIEYEQAGSVAALSIPSADHYWPFLYALGARHPDEALEVATNYLEYGSLSMLSLVFGQTAETSGTALLTP